MAMQLMRNANGEWVVEFGQPLGNALLQPSRALGGVVQAEGTTAASAADPRAASVKAVPGVSPAAAAATVPVAAPATARSNVVEAVWNDFLGGFLRKDICKMMSCYDESSHLRIYSNIDGAKMDLHGTQSISQFYGRLLSDLGQGALEVQLSDVDEDAGQVFFAWRCPGSGVLAATSTFIYARSMKIWKENLVLTQVPRLAAVLMSAAGSSNRPGLGAPTVSSTPLPRAIAPAAVSPKPLLHATVSAAGADSPLAMASPPGGSVGWPISASAQAQGFRTLDQLSAVESKLVNETSSRRA